MIKEKAITRAVRLTLVVAGLTSLPVLAQQSANVVQVTGTRITSPGITSNSPISSVTAEEIRSTQPIAVEEFFKTLPSATPATGPGTNNGTGGGASIDLRGLGANRSLVLINGRRIVPFNLNGTVDTNSIPLALINRVDVLTGGASVVYGADAVAGVANFNLRRNFTGVDLTTTYGATADEHDTKRRRTDLTMGSSLADGRGNVVLSIGKTKSDPVTQGERDFSVINLNSVTGQPTGSFTAVPGVFSTGIGPGGTTTLAGNWQINPATGALVSPAVPWNTNPSNYYQTGLDSTQVTSLANFRINDHAEVYTDVFYTGSEVMSALAQTGTFGNTYNVPIGNPYIPQPMREQLCLRRGIPLANCVAGNATNVPLLVNRRFTEMGPRYSNFENKTLQYTIGLKGDLIGDWTYDTYWSRGTAEQTQTRINWGSGTRVQQALNALSTTACVNPANGCVPLNVFGAEGTITPEQIAFINQTTMLRQKVQQDVGQLAVSGNLGETIRSPFAEDPIAVSLMAEHRKVSANTQSDAASQIQGEVLGTGAPTPDRRGEFKLMEYAVEMFVPLVKNKPFMRSLNAELGYRETSFKTNSKTNYGSWKAGGEWAPVQSFRVRGMLQKATRAPNVNELFAPRVTGLSNLATDPCQGRNISAGDANTAGTLANLCRLTGVPLSEIGSLPGPSSGQINNLGGGNPELGPESAKTRTFGFVLEPLPRLAMSVDYYKIEIEDAVSSPSTTDILDGCYNPGLNPGLTFNSYCEMIGRNTINGTLNGNEARGVLTPQSNLGTQSTAGFDLNVAYRANMSQLGLDSRYGSLDLSLGANFVTDYKFQATPTSLERDCLGYYSVACNNVVSGPMFKRKFIQRTTWNVGAFSVGYNWRYQSAVIEEPGGTDFFPAYASIKAYHYVDLNANWRFNENVRLTLSVNNLGDKKPPIVGGSIGSTSVNAGNTFPQTYDVIGRYITLGANVRF
ncbi:TonB-dependent receptor domain-containing protein [Massilia sp. YIM B02443]|uniref:TonB-dependent receptor domain-containing protein n=1 Tax=Massilia sp. YIM B02443 TaxID=3050127 RepID=UPI0025B648FF|nr:TonB-dependent receptor [Massilia sp. YIM B02443]MDN4036025.1 TonB-dependent receptor [Massilia sp. YIM B02443]